jgi:hypothetical protein
MAAPAATQPFLKGLDFLNGGFYLAYRGAEEPQVLTIELKLDAPSPDGLAALIMATLVDVINHGAAGGAEFAPTTGSAKILSGPSSPAHEGAKGPLFRWELEVAGVSPLFMRNIVEALRKAGDLNVQPVRSLAISGSLPVDTSALSVRDAFLGLWVCDTTTYPKAWPTPGFLIKDYETATGARVRARTAGRANAKTLRAFHETAECWLNAIAEYPARSDPAPGFAEYIPELAHTRSELVARYHVFDYTPLAARDTLINCLCWFHANVAPLVEAEIGL